MVTKKKEEFVPQLAARWNYAKVKQKHLRKVSVFLVPEEGIEPPTQGSSGPRSTTELLRHHFWYYNSSLQNIEE